MRSAPGAWPVRSPGLGREPPDAGVNPHLEAQPGSDPFGHARVLRRPDRHGDENIGRKSTSVCGIQSIRALTVVIMPAGPTETLPQLTVARNGVTVCANVPAG